MTFSKVISFGFLKLLGSGLAVGCIGVALCGAQNQTPKALVSGLVVDPSGARVMGAAVHVALEPGEDAQEPESLDLVTDAAGRFSARISQGTYLVSVSASGFQTAAETHVHVAAGSKVELNFKLIIRQHAETVDVPSETHSSLDAGDNKSALVFDGDRLAALSDDDATMQQQLLAMAGGTRSPEIYVDGFSGGKFPPKSSIRQVRINQNPYSASYDSLGFGRIEVFTKPGTGSLHGTLGSNGTDAALDAPNPYAPFQPPYHSVYLDGTLSGPLGKKTSFFVGSNYHDQANNAVVNAVNPDQLDTRLAEADPNPRHTQDYSIRIDRQMSTNNIFTGRWEYNHTAQTNAGVGLLVLQSEGYSTANGSSRLQLSNTQIVTPKLISETRFQWLRTRLDQSVVSTAPTVIVQGAFNGGGSPAGSLQDHQDQFEFQEYLSIDQGKHYVRAGARYRLLREANSSDANYNGEFIFPTLAAYTLKQPTEFVQTTGEKSAKLLTGDLGLYAEDEWKLAKSLTVNYGLRFETQSAIPDHANWAPRLGFAWAVGKHDKKPALVVLRGGFGLFYERFAAANLLTSIRQNGVSQQTFVDTTGLSYPNVPMRVAGDGTPPTPYRVSPSLHAQYAMVAGFTVERQFGKLGTVSLNYYGIRGVHQYLSRNINAPLPGTYDPNVPTSGIRPLGGNGDVYQFSSDGISNDNIFFVNSNLNLTKKISFFGYFVAERERTETSGATSFPSNQYNLRQDYGRSGTAPESYYLSIYARLPGGFTVDPFVNGSLGGPFNITIGQDLNGDAQYNDRPAFATDLTRPSVRKTSYGNFDIAPQPGQTIIPINYGNSPSYVALSVEVTKSIPLGPRPAAKPETAEKGGDAKAPAAKAPAAKADRPYSLSFSVEARNLFNHTNPGPPVGVLESPLFGQSISLNTGFSTNASANRTIMLRTSFSF